MVSVLDSCTFVRYVEIILTRFDNHTEGVWLIDWVLYYRFDSVELLDDYQDLVPWEMCCHWLGIRWRKTITITLTDWCYSCWMFFFPLSSLIETWYEPLWHLICQKCYWVGLWPLESCKRALLLLFLFTQLCHFLECAYFPVATPRQIYEDPTQKRVILENCMQKLVRFKFFIEVESVSGSTFFGACGNWATKVSAWSVRQKLSCCLGCRKIR